jgi:hypothetical protein
MIWNGNRVLNDQYILFENLAEHRIDTALLNERNLQPTKKWSIPAYTTYIHVYIEKKDIDRHIEDQLYQENRQFITTKANLLQFTALGATAANILTRTETLIIGSVYALLSQPLLVQILKTLSNYNQKFVFDDDYEAKHKLWHSRLT